MAGRADNGVLYRTGATGIDTARPVLRCRRLSIPDRAGLGQTFETGWPMLLRHDVIDMKRQRISHSMERAVFASGLRRGARPFRSLSFADHETPGAGAIKPLLSSTRHERRAPRSTTRTPPLVARVLCAAFAAGNGAPLIGERAATRGHRAKGVSRGAEHGFRSARTELLLSILGAPCHSLGEGVLSLHERVGRKPLTAFADFQNRNRPRDYPVAKRRTCKSRCRTRMKTL